MTILCIAVGGEEERCIDRWFKKATNGDFVTSPSLNSKFGLVITGTNFMGEGEGRISRLLRSKSWQKTAAGEALVVACI